MKILIFSFLLCGVAFAAPAVELSLDSAKAFHDISLKYDHLSPYEQIETINEFIDIMLEELRLFMIHQGYDPMALPEMHQTISGAKLDLTNGMVRNISTIRREDDIVLIYDERILNAEVPLKFANFEINYDYKISLWSTNVGGNVTGKVESMGMYLAIEMNFKDLILTLKEFKIDEIGSMDIKFQGGSIDWLMNLLTGAITTFFKDTIGTMVGGIVTELLNQIIAIVNEILASIKG